MSASNAVTGPAGSGVVRIATRFFGCLPNGVSKAATKAYFKSQAFCRLGRHGTHSDQKLIQHNKMQVKILPALSDNYMYLIIDEKSGDAAVVDPVAPETVAEAVKGAGVNLTTVLTTHHHWDHSGGNNKLVELMSSSRQLSVYGGDDRIDALTHKVGHGSKLSVGSLNVECLFTPCHTTGHICYYVTQSAADPAASSTFGENGSAVFTGDTLFLGGCGRFFEGTAEQMQEALNVKLASLPDETLVYCGHEYAIQNLSFGHHVEPENADIAKQLADMRELRGRNPPLPSVPSTIGKEKLINPFMRVSAPTVRAAVGMELSASDNDVMRAVRTLKDNFKPPK